MRAPLGRRPARSVQHYAVLKQEHGRIADAAVRARSAKPLDSKLIVRVPKPVLRELTAARRVPTTLQTLQPRTPQPVIAVPQRAPVLRREETPAPKPVMMQPVRPAALPPAYWPSHRRRPMTNAPMPA